MLSNYGKVFMMEGRGNHSIVFKMVYDYAYDFMWKNDMDKDRFNLEISITEETVNAQPSMFSEPEFKEMTVGVFKLTEKQEG